MQVALEQLSGKRDNVVITMGDQGLLWAKDGKSGSLDAFKVNAIDSTGAGDAFHGAFAFGIARGMGWHELLRFASAAGALTCTRLGARAGLPIAPEVAALMNGSDQAILETSLALFPPDIKSEQ
jgi:sugar/nucleoside kinase (ribokinase family)